MIPQISITDFGFDDRTSCFGLPTGGHTDHSTIGLPLPNTRDRDSGVSSDNSAYSTEMSTPAGIDFSRRSSAYSIGYECSTINRNMPTAPYYRQISFDHAWGFVQHLKPIARLLEQPKLTAPLVLFVVASILLGTLNHSEVLVRVSLE